MEYTQTMRNNFDICTKNSNFAGKILKFKKNEIGICFK